MNSGRISKFMIQRAFGEIWKVEGLPIAAMLPVQIKGNEIHLKSRERCWRKIKYMKLWRENFINDIKWNPLSRNGYGNGNFWPVLAFLLVVWVWIIANIYWETFKELNSWSLLLGNTSRYIGFFGIKLPWIYVHFSGVRLGTDWGSGRWYHGTECGRNPEAAWQPGEPVQSRPFWLSLPWSKWTLLIWPTRAELGISG